MRAYERFLNYVKIHTTSDEDSTTQPSTLRQLELANLLVSEMQQLGIDNVRLSPQGYVYGELPATPGCEDKPALGLIAHMDTAPDASGENVTPQVIENYNGGDVLLAGSGDYLRIAQFPELARWKGQTLITTDGTTLLGADDKAGIAEILTFAERILAGSTPHGKVCIAFTPDEEIGCGADHFDVKGFGADYAYTVDGGDVGELEYQNFNAASAVFDIKGFSVHPGSAKGLMKNAQQLAMQLHAMLPQNETPETTEGWQGFYHLTGMSGQVEKAKLSYIVRDHDAELFGQRKAFLQTVADKMNEIHGPGTVTLTLKDSYYNMEEKIRPHWHLIENAEAAIAKAGVKPHIVPIRGGTDGSRLSYMGLPCPNLGTGGFNFHGPCEYITAEKMDAAVEILLNIVRIYAQ